MNVILVAEKEVLESRLTLSDHRAKHIVKVLKSDIGDTINLGIINGNLGRGLIVSIKRKYPFYVDIDTVFDRLPPVKQQVDLLLALPRPIMLKRIFSQAASLGVETLHITNANRVEKSFWEAGLLHKREYMQHLLHGLEQAVDTVVPNVVFHRRFKPFIEDHFPGISEKYSHLVLAHPDSQQKLHNIITERPGKILLAIGPEGGWVDYEVKKLQEYGFKDFTIGERILKVDTAVINIHGRILAELERLN